jgi:hypothetical protein
LLCSSIGKSTYKLVEIGHICSWKIRHILCTIRYSGRSLPHGEVDIVARESRSMVMLDSSMSLLFSGNHLISYEDVSGMGGDREQFVLIMLKTREFDSDLWRNSESSPCASRGFPHWLP